ncbi:hypothetical protein BJ508DRAFT_161175 [Ascobolus immersus RN42]|uniref:Uncharacterized protein n=1 Tax=Ascobolus immersus RN42 TaxID=1160509 RepID=A0A3N4I8J2_ASCIM|nr:hypothetical protein BJ508DRAFT_161175 [Ascobolus immersus RN42]
MIRGSFLFPIPGYLHKSHHSNSSPERRDNPIRTSPTAHQPTNVPFASPSTPFGILEALVTRQSSLAPTRKVDRTLSTALGGMSCRWLHKLKIGGESERCLRCTVTPTQGTVSKRTGIPSVLDVGNWLACELTPGTEASIRGWSNMGMSGYRR